MADRDLEGRIRDCLEFQIRDTFTHVSRYDKLVIVAGNGLTLIAAGLRDPDLGLGWRRWCEQALKRSESPQTVDYMLSLGYGLPDIFEYALSRAQELPGQRRQEIIRDIWELLWKETVRVEPSPLHSAILQTASSVITTNYDDLFEEAAKRDSLSVVSKRLTVTGSAPTFERIFPEWENKREKTVWKIHGSFLPRGETPDRSFEQWLQEMPSPGGTRSYRGPSSTVADWGAYLSLALLQREIFRELFDPVIEDLKGALVLFIGLGFGSQELVLSRILQEALEERNRPKMLSLVVTPRLDPLWKYKRFLISPLHVPLGLVASASTRLLAHLVALELLTTHAMASSPKGPSICSSIIKDTFENPSSVRNLIGDSVPRMRSRIVAIGQASVNRVLGLETAVSQEMAYTPRYSASWGPCDDGSVDETKWLTNLEVGGQALVPVMVWDALGIPCSIVARIYADDMGEKILSRLERTKWVDFEWIGMNQDTSRPRFLPNSIPATENATVVTWFGLRTILDSYRQLRRDENPHDRGLAFSTKDARSDAEENANSHVLLLGAPLLYVTKVRWEEIRDEMQSLRTAGELSTFPLIVYDSGGQGKAGAEAWVAENEGIIVASAFAGLVWLQTPRHVLQDASQAQTAQTELTRLLHSEGPKDDRGRLFQILRVLDNLKDLGRGNSQIPAFLEEGHLLNRARSFILTLGELGAVYWVRDGRAWSEAKWCGPTNDSGSIDEIELRETRSGLECGDVARAGLAASLLTHFTQQGTPAVQIATDDIQRAIGWANWFGAHKLRFFALDGYLNFLNAHGLTLEHLHEPQSMPFPETYAFGHCDRCKRIMSFRPLCSQGDFVKTVADWYQKASDLFHNPIAWEKRCRKWQGERYGHK